MRQSPIKQLYEKLRKSSEIPVIESSEIISKGEYILDADNFIDVEFEAVPVNKNAD